MQNVVDVNGFLEEKNETNGRRFHPLPDHDYRFGQKQHSLAGGNHWTDRHA